MNRYKRLYTFHTEGTVSIHPSFADYFESIKKKHGYDNGKPICKGEEEKG